LFSVIIPCWNAARTLDETLASVLAQTLFNWEAILVDDGSTDETSDILTHWALRDPRFRVVVSVNKGPSHARNLAAFALARGQYLAFLDADDLWAPRKLQMMADAFKARSDLDGLYARVAFFRGAPGAARSRSTILPHPLTPADLLRENAVCTMSNLVVRTDCFRRTEGFNPNTVHSEDLEWLVVATALGARIEGLAEELVFYRASDDGLSVDFESMHGGWRNAVLAAGRLGFVLAPRALRAAEAVHLRYLARRALRVRVRRFTALRLALRGALRSPTGFFGDPWRGGMTFLAAALEPVLPSRLRRFVFSL
jgi:glycosyltransferase involved in cell wall biosynthesis